MIIGYIGAIFAFISFIFLIYSRGFKDGIKLFSLYAIIGIVCGLILEVEIFGKAGEYIFLLLTIIYGLFLYYRCGKELSNSVEGQGICIKRALKQFIGKLKR
ncbi:MAG: hypothetical protein PHE67_12375 [Campylobacterales bacterium]|nr:hypothetical protein [Campylobacterales bacterium]